MHRLSCWPKGAVRVMGIAQIASRECLKEGATVRDPYRNFLFLGLLVDQVGLHGLRKRQAFAFSFKRSVGRQHG